MINVTWYWLDLCKENVPFQLYTSSKQKSKVAWTSHFTFIISAVPFALAQWSAMESSLMTHAVTLTDNHTPALEEQWASLADVWQICPIWHPLVASGIPFPAPVTWIWYVRDSREGLLPDESCCVKSPLGMLEESILGRWDGAWASILGGPAPQYFGTGGPTIGAPQYFSSTNVTRATEDGCSSTSLCIILSFAACHIAAHSVVEWSWLPSSNYSSSEAV